MPAKSKADAINEVDTRMISPATCFVRFINTAKGWGPIPGTGCAHYVAHILGIRHGRMGISACDLGFTFKVPLLIHDMTRIEPAHAQVNDVWVNGAQDHCGIVIGVEPPAADSSSDLPTITISQCSSNERAGRLGVNQQDWLAFFGGHGSFYRR